MAWWGLQQWAISKVEKIVDEEAETVSLKNGGFHLADKKATWDFVLNFSTLKFLSVLERKGLTIFWLLLAAAIPESKRPVQQLPNTTDNEQNNSIDSQNKGDGTGDPPSPSFVPYFETALSTGRGQNWQDPFMVCSLFIDEWE